MITADATPAQIPALLERIGEARAAALAARAGRDAAAVIAENIAHSTLTWCSRDAAGVVAMGGVVPMAEGDCGYVWQFVIQEAVRANKRAYLEMAAGMMRAALRHWRRNGGSIGAPQLVNGVRACVCERVR